MPDQSEEEIRELEALASPGKTADFSKHRLPSDPETWTVYVKREPTRAKRIEGPFSVDMGGGDILHCEDGYLAYDVRHIPFPVPAAEFDRIYKPVED